MPLHQFQEPQRPPPVEQEVLVHHEERADRHRLGQSIHHLEQLVARLVEVDELPLAAEHRRSGAEIAAQRAAHRGDNRGGNVPRLAAHRHAQAARVQARVDQRMSQRLLWVLAQEAAEPAHAVAAHDVVGVDLPLQVGNVGDVSPHDDRRPRLLPAHELAHRAHFGQVRDDTGDADNVVGLLADLLPEAVESGKVEHGARGREIGLHQHQSPTAVEHPQRERPLHAGHLVVIQLHGVERPAAAIVVAPVGPEDAGQQHASLASQRMDGGRRGSIARLVVRSCGRHDNRSYEMSRRWAVLAIAAPHSMIRLGF